MTILFMPEPDPLPSDSVAAQHRLIEQHHRELRDALNEFEEQARADFGLASKMGEHPVAVVLTGFCVGLWLATR